VRFAQLSYRRKEILIYAILIALAATALTYHVTSGTEAGNAVEVGNRTEWNTYHGEHDGSAGPLWLFATLRHTVLFDHAEMVASDWWQNPQSKRRALLLHLRDGITCPYCVSFTLSVIVSAIVQPDSWFLVGLAAAGLNVVGWAIAGLIGRLAKWAKSELELLFGAWRLGSISRRDRTNA